MASGIHVSDLRPPHPKMAPADITWMPDNYIFVFGSNQAGIHGKGAAKDAWAWFGAQWGDGEGMTGRCYAIPTKDFKLQVRPLSRISQSIELFVATARVRRDRQFYLTMVGCGLAQYTAAEIAPLFFFDNNPPENIWWPREFLKYHPYEFSKRIKNETKPN